MGEALGPKKAAPKNLKVSIMKVDEQASTRRRRVEACSSTFIIDQVCTHVLWLATNRYTSRTNSQRPAQRRWPSRYNPRSWREYRGNCYKSRYSCRGWDWAWLRRQMHRTHRQTSRNYRRRSANAG